MVEYVEDDPELEKARRDTKALKELTEHPGWAILETIVKKQIDQRTNQVMLTPRGSQRTEYEHEFLKGEAAGMRIVLALAHAEVETNSAVIGALDDYTNESGDE